MYLQLDSILIYYYIYIHTGLYIRMKKYSELQVGDNHHPHNIHCIQGVCFIIGCIFRCMCDVYDQCRSRESLKIAK